MESGTRIGIYEIVAKIGEGGMGEVYRARDTKLDRDVALKVLPALFTSDPDRLARFEREAKVLASLNHPNIAQVFGFEGHAIAMELVDGPTLAEIIAGNEGAAAALTIDRALPIMRQIAAALEAAHDQGIIHRDLKPANVKVREDGTVKVLDFGLAKAFAADAESAASGMANSPTLTARSTQMGMILGTAAYMSPEQAKGRPVDRRADVWAFGVVFFELIAGRRAFEGDDVSDVLASVLKMEPDWSVLPANLPPPVRRLLRRCLEKDPKKRLRDVAEGMLQLEEGLATGSMTSVMMPVVGDLSAVIAAPTRPLWRRALPLVATAAVAALATIGVNQFMAPQPSVTPPVRFSFDTAPARLNISASRQDIAISPDGRTITYSGFTRTAASLYIRRLDQLEAAQLRGGEGAFGPFFSPDSNWVGFIDPGDLNQIKKVSVLGGPAVSVCRSATPILSASWTSDGTIIMGGVGALQQVSEAGGTPAPLTELDKTSQDLDHLWPSAVPGTPLVLFVANGGSRSPLVTGQLAVVDRATRRVVRLGIVGSHPRYVASGHLVYAVEDGTLRAVRFNTRDLSVSGNPVLVADAVSVKPSGAANFDVSGDGRLIYVGGGVGGGLRTLAWVDRAGRETPIAAPARSYYYARVSPDGKRLSLDVRDQDEDIWIWDLVRETMQRLTDKPGADQYGLWTRDGQRVVFSSSMNGRSELFWHRPDGVGAPEQLSDTSAEKLVPFPNAITSDGKQLIFRAVVGGKNDLFTVDIGGDRKPKKLLSTEHDELNPALSPDGKFMAFESDLSGKFEVYVRPFPDVNREQWTVSIAGGTEAVWALSGREIYYLATDGKLMAVPVTAARGLELGKPVALFDAVPYFFGGTGRNYDIAPDGKRFVMVKNLGTANAGGVPITVVLNWMDELKARVK